jgi:hypothetical protein
MVLMSGQNPAVQLVTDILSCNIYLHVGCYRLARPRVSSPRNCEHCLQKFGMTPLSIGLSQDPIDKEEQTNIKNAGIRLFPDSKLMLLSMGHSVAEHAVPRDIQATGSHGTLQARHKVTGIYLSGL